MRNTGFAALLTVLPVALTGCAELRHNDVMLFGTKTKLALDASAPPENAGVPEVSIGYKRAEFVWMPLYVNAEHSEFGPGSTKAEEIGTSSGANAAKYMGTDKETGSDTYSVLASFGADVKAGATATGGAQGAVGLAQYFATGHAARILADSGADLVNVQAPSREALDQAKIRAEENLSRALTAEQLATAKTLGIEDLGRVKGQAALILDHVQPTGDFDAAATARLTKLLDAAKTGQNLDASVSGEIAKAKSADQLRQKLTQFNGSVPKIFSALYKQQAL